MSLAPVPGCPPGVSPPLFKYYARTAEFRSKIVGLLTRFHQKLLARATDGEGISSEFASFFPIDRDGTARDSTYS